MVPGISRDVPGTKRCCTWDHLYFVPKNLNNNNNKTEILKELTKFVVFAVILRYFAEKSIKRQDCVMFFFFLIQILIGSELILFGELKLNNLKYTNVKRNEYHRKVIK